jgi:hypothetical protein
VIGGGLPCRQLALKRPTVAPAEGLLSEAVLKHTCVVPLFELRSASAIRSSLAADPEDCGPGAGCTDVGISRSCTPSWDSHRSRRRNCFARCCCRRSIRCARSPCSASRCSCGRVRQEVAPSARRLRLCHVPELTKAERDTRPSPQRRGIAARVQHAGRSIGRHRPRSRRSALHRKGSSIRAKA